MKRLILTLFLLSPTFVWADEFHTCVQGLKAPAAQKGVRAETFASATEGLKPDMKVLDFLDFQPEFKTPVWDYLASLVDEERVTDGKGMMRTWSNALTAAETRFDVDKYIVAAVWGVESDFGRSMGKRPLVQSLATLSCFGRRQAYFRTEFVATLQILEHGDIEPDHLNGSWAGAFGQTQFMPSTFLRMAVDMEGNGHRDIVDSVPDALGSTANYLHKSGWDSDLPWGFEVSVPESYKGPTGRSHKQTMAAYANAGVERVDGQPLGEGNAGLLLPAGRDGPAFLVTKNFDAIYAYNASESYALAIAHLADRMRGGKDFVTPWPTDDPGLSRAQRREIQVLLNKRGYGVGEPDGAIGTKTKEALADFQQKHGLEVSSRPNLKVLRALQGLD
eukprot:gene10078-10147_t